MNVARKLWLRMPRKFRVRVKRTIRRRPGGLILDPVSDIYGIDRGTPIDRLYIERFLRTHREDIAGRVLEVKEDRYASMIGGPAVREVEILDVEAGNPNVTLVADLAEKDSLPESSFDCFILTQTLQYVEDPLAALTNVRRTLKTGGILLLSVPGATRLDPSVPDQDRWRFTKAGVTTLLSKTFTSDDVLVTQFGNLSSTIGFFAGLSAEEMRSDHVEPNDPYFPLVVCARAEKSVEG